jgi:hypothetical protein
VIAWAISMVVLAFVAIDSILYFVCLWRMTKPPLRFWLAILPGSGFWFWFHREKQRP